MLMETISRIEQKQEEQQKLLEKMMNQQSTIPMAAAAVMEKRQKLIEENSMWESINDVSVLTKEDKKEEEEIPDFEEAFAELIKGYNQMSAEERPETIRKLIRNSSTRDTERLSELLDLFWTEGLQKEPSFGSRPAPRDRSAISNTPNNPISCSKEGEGCNCVECPHKLELERIDEFYKEFLSSGISNSVSNL